MTIHGSLFTDFAEKPSQDPFSLQNKKLLRVDMRYGPVQARTGSMVAYQGDVRFQNRGSGGMGKFLKAAATGEGVRMMECTGSGELFLADEAAEVQVMYLEDDAISVNGRNVLAFSSSIQWDIHRIQARGAMMTGGLYNVSLRGTGYVAVTTKGDPIALDVASSPTFADAQAVVLWTAGVTMDVRVDTGGLGSMIRGGTGELLQMAFGGQGYVLVQPSENVVDGGHQGGGGKGGGMLGDLLGG
ncbi:AIM24 family protein [Phycicoccus endophyticus]|uniref:AIM24 family protein n=1 Tax=Phycicoccus endophyticus TaxID=1690220 RepID=A0A7G9R1C6_9MICO|nr:AIM24 family protein [Phycicoccus endophyticus]NHI18817.1 AIM24 family protein [Phycicoccus endophyticus]QNN49401.1 AIM24 family protein [Phycicoccus endophyticus]